MLMDAPPLRLRCRRRGIAAGAPLALWLACAVAGRVEAGAPDLASLSLEDLMEIEVTSAAKRAQAVLDSAAAVYVITNEDIRRSGLTSIPELLRLVPGLHVAQIDASRWAITARGFNSQFANKLLVLIDGRTVYTHLFSGVFWDIQDVLLEDVERIEVVRGPGSTLWGANAVNGVINIITKNARDTQGALAAGGAGTAERAFGRGRYGAKIGDNAWVRGYVKYFDRSDFDNPRGSPANDEWDQIRGGFRMDWDPSTRDAVTVQGDYYSGNSDSTLVNLVPSEDDVDGGNILGRWHHTFSERSEVTTRLYFDRTERTVEHLISEDRNTFDIEFEHRIRIGSIHDLVWGLGYRLLNDSIDDNVFLRFVPSSRTNNLFSGFLQNQTTLVDGRLQITIGSKLEHNDFTGFEVQPTARALYKATPRQSVWGAVSRAVRTPSRADEDVQFFNTQGAAPGTLAFYTGNSDFESEDLVAYELGYRSELRRDLSVDLAAYYNDYDNLRTTEFSPVALPSPPFPPSTFPAPFGNKASAQGYGVELAANWRVTDYLLLAGWYTFMKLDVDPSSTSTDTAVSGQGHDTPLHQVHVRSRLNLPRNVEFDTNLFWVNDVSNQGVNPYTRLDLRLGWHPTEHVELSVVGQNLTEGRHPEWGNGFFNLRTQVPRGMYGLVTIRY
jgi:iron complex outermembrane receptor protein